MTGRCEVGAAWKTLGRAYTGHGHAVYTHPIYLSTDADRHPERRTVARDPAVLTTCFEALDRSRSAGDPETITAVHPKLYVERLCAVGERAVRHDADTVLSPKSLRALTVGAANAAVDDVFAMRADNVRRSRPPGIMPRRRRRWVLPPTRRPRPATQKAHGAERIAIVDWDVHHGNGTQDIFWTIRRCCTARRTDAALSRHRGEERDGAGNIVNAPLSRARAQSCSAAPS